MSLSVLLFPCMAEIRGSMDITKRTFDLRVLNNSMLIQLCKTLEQVKIIKIQLPHGQKKTYTRIRIYTL